MVKHTLQLNDIFQSLADPTRRDIIQRVSERERTISELVSNYSMSFAAVSKHVSVLEKANLVAKRKEGKKYMVALVPETFKEADKYLEQYRTMWQGRFNKLDELLQNKE